MLALWIDLQQAVENRDHHDRPTSQWTPWKCTDNRVREAWEKLTDPRNALPLENLYYQIPEGPQLELAKEALRACRANQAAISAN